MAGKSKKPISKIERSTKKDRLEVLVENMGDKIGLLAESVSLVNEKMDSGFAEIKNDLASFENQTNSNFKELFSFRDETRTNFKELFSFRDETRTNFKELFNFRDETRTNFKELFNFRDETRTNFKELFNFRDETRINFKTVFELLSHVDDELRQIKADFSRSKESGFSKEEAIAFESRIRCLERGLEECKNLLKNR